MNRVYRILRRPYAKRPLDGEGAYRLGGRWSRAGTRVAYTAEHLSLAMVEYFIHLEVGAAPDDLVVVTADVPKNVSRAKISTAELPRNWRMMPAPPELAHIGERFVNDGKVGVLIVPSAIVRGECNWLLNPAHRDFARVTLRATEGFEYDLRFFR